MDDFKRNLQNISVCFCCCLSSTASKSYQLMSYMVTCGLSSQWSVSWPHGEKTTAGTHVWSLSMYGRRDKSIELYYCRESNPDGLLVWSVSWPV